jgi:uncharacterized protein
MKASKYNIYFNHLDKKIGYNTFSRQFIALDPELSSLFEAGINENNVEGLKEIHPDFYSFLIEKGFIIESEIDEFEKVKLLSQKIDNDDSSFRLHINPTMNCNFKCWYCYETHIKDSKMSSITINKTLQFVENIFKEKKGLKEFHLGWFGGEPLLYFEKVIKPLLTKIRSMAEEYKISFSSAITTNGLLVNQEVIDISKKNGLDFFQITLDGNEEQHNKVRFISKEKGSYKQIVENIILIAKNKINVQARINCSVETLMGLNDVVLDFEQLNSEERSYLHFDLHKVWQVTTDLDEQLSKSRDYFKKKGFTVSGGFHDTVMSSCYGDKRNHATINYNGEVFKCTARDFTSSNKEGVLNQDGKIIWNEKFEKRLNSKFKNKPCMDCKILPICGGGCSQQALEHEGVDYCVHDFNEEKKLEMVKERFFQTVMV